MTKIEIENKISALYDHLGALSAQIISMEQRLNKLEVDIAGKSDDESDS